MNARLVTGLVLLGAFGAALVFWPDTDDRTADTVGKSGPNVAIASPGSCLPCHAEVVAEWRQSMHSQAFTDPQVRAPDQSDNFRKPECIPCHAAEPIFSYGIEDGTRALARTARRQDGIDCLSCHGLPQGGVASSRTGLTAACQPVYEAKMQTDSLCAPCHNQHDTHVEWRASPAAERGETCFTCHMPPVKRDGSEAGAPRAGRDHRFLGGRDHDFAASSFTLAHELTDDGRQLSVTITNTFAGHNLPTDSRNRALDLVVTLLDARGAEVPKAEGVGDRFPGGETGTARLRFRNPYRSSGDPTTQIPAGESRTLTLPVPETARKAVIEVFYKLQPWIPDSEARWSERQEFELPG
ncbi:MAG: hypothetical protein H6825_15710 [Planctomycetes bacterium]|nr:hypothetical protein [Planctomycetota bacterium]